MCSQIFNEHKAFPAPCSITSKASMHRGEDIIEDQLEIERTWSRLMANCSKSQQPINVNPHVQRNIHKVHASFYWMLRTAHADITIIGCWHLTTQQQTWTKETFTILKPTAILKRKKRQLRNIIPHNIYVDSTYSCSAFLFRPPLHHILRYNY